jgi:hypothetical protein
MHWLVKTLLDGEPFEEVHCEGTPPIPEQGAELMLPRDDEDYVPAIVSELIVDRRNEPAILKVICVSPSGRKPR